MSLSLPQLLDVTGLGMHPSHRASLHAPENTRLWFSSHLIETGLSMPSGWVSRWIFTGDLAGSVHVVLLGVYSTAMLGSLLQNTKTLLSAGLWYCDFSQLVKYTWGQSLWRWVISVTFVVVSCSEKMSYFCAKEPWQFPRSCLFPLNCITLSLCSSR